LFIRVAFKATLVSIGECPGLAEGGRAMSVVAVAALNQAFVDAVVIGLGKVSLGRGMAAIAETGLSLNQQMFWLLGVMRGVAVQTADVVARVCRTREVPLLVLFSVATQATGAGFLPRKLREANNLGDVATALNMFRSGPMTGLTAVPVLKGGLVVRRGLEVLFVQIFVARLANSDLGVLRSPLGGGCDILLLPGGNSGSHQQEQP
jgi:hypothetical protein